MHLPRRLGLLLAIFASLAGLMLFGNPEDHSPAVVSAPRPKAPSTGSGKTEGLHRFAGKAAILELRERHATDKNDTPPDAFAARDWTPPPPPLPPPPPPAAPQAPPLPFTYLGKQLEDGEWTVFLAHQDRTYALKADAPIESSYRIDRIAPPTLTLIYLPLQQAQTIFIGSAE